MVASDPSNSAEAGLFEGQNLEANAAGGSGGGEELRLRSPQK